MYGQSKGQISLHSKFSSFGDTDVVVVVGFSFIVIYSYPARLTVYVP